MIQADSAIHVDSAASAEVESVTYIPAGGVETSPFNVQVFRELPDGIPGSSVGNAPVVAIFMRRHATLGRSTINRGGDKIRISVKKNGTAELLQVTEIISEDAGGFLLRLR
jgi:hypothetical protein